MPKIACGCDIPEGRTDGPNAPKLCEVHKRIVLEMIDKCIWWPESFKRQHPDNETIMWMADELLVHFQAGRERVSEGGPFDSYSVAE